MSGIPQIPVYADLDEFGGTSTRYFYIIYLGFKNVPFTTER